MAEPKKIINGTVGDFKIYEYAIFFDGLILAVKIEEKWYSVDKLKSLKHWEFSDNRAVAESLIAEFNITMMPKEYQTAIESIAYDKVAKSKLKEGIPIEVILVGREMGIE